MASHSPKTVGIRRFCHLCIATAGAFVVASAAAQSRWVFVNGQRLDPTQVAELERLHCAAIPSGSYWLNLHSGAWGYAGNPRAQGLLGDRCRATGADVPRKSLSERGLLYRPGEILNGR